MSLNLLALDNELDDLNSILRTPMVEGENLSLQEVL